MIPQISLKISSMLIIELLKPVELNFHILIYILGFEDFEF